MGYGVDLPEQTRRKRLDRAIQAVAWVLLLDVVLTGMLLHAGVTFVRYIDAQRFCWQGLLCFMGVAVLMVATPAALWLFYLAYRGTINEVCKEARR